MRSNSFAIVLVVFAAAVLRVLRMHVRWDELTLAYAAYPEPLVQAVEQGHPTALFGSWIGLHPPLWGIVHAVLEVLAPIPWVWMGLSVAASILAVCVIGRAGGLVAAMVLASAPVHLLDAAEVNNYPMASLAVAMLLLSARGHWIGLVVAAVLAGWTHLLAGWVAFFVVAWRVWDGPREERWKLVGWSFLGLLPVGAGALRLMGQGSTWAQPAAHLSDWFSLMFETLGPEGVVLAPLVLIGLTGVVRVGWLSLGGGLLFAVVLGAAAAHQRPYFGLVAPIAALAVADAVKRFPRLLWFVVLLCSVRAVRFAADDVERIQSVMGDLATTRGVDVAIDGARQGDTIWLVSPALQADDDKTATGPVMWRFRPWHAMSIAHPVSFEYKDYRYGQPRIWNDLTVHTSTELDAAAFDHVAAAVLERQQRLWVVLYDHSPATGLVERIERTLRPYDYAWQLVGKDQGLGVDRVAIVQGAP